MKKQYCIALSLILLVIALASSGCVGMAHSSHVCCSDTPGKYYRATRVDMKVMKESPLMIPIVLVLDLPFALVFETLEMPFILAGVHDPRPPHIAPIDFTDKRDDKAPQQTPAGDVPKAAPEEWRWTEEKPR